MRTALHGNKDNRKSIIDMGINLKNKIAACLSIICIVLHVALFWGKVRFKGLYDGSQRRQWQDQTATDGALSGKILHTRLTRLD